MQANMTGQKFGTKVESRIFSWGSTTIFLFELLARVFYDPYYFSHRSKSIKYKGRKRASGAEQKTSLMGTLNIGYGYNAGRDLSLGLVTIRR